MAVKRGTVSHEGSPVKDDCFGLAKASGMAVSTGQVRILRVLSDGKKRAAYPLAKECGVAMSGRRGDPRWKWRVMLKGLVGLGAVSEEGTDLGSGHRKKVYRITPSGRTFLRHLEWDARNAKGVTRIRPVLGVQPDEEPPY